MSSVISGGDTVGVGVRSSGDGGALNRWAGSGAASGAKGTPIGMGGGSAGGAAALIRGCGAAGWADRRCRMTLVELARAINWFCWSSTSASATASCWPRCTTRPIDRSMPESAVTAFRKLIWSSAVVKFSPGASVLKTANPIALSAREVSAPP